MSGSFDPVAFGARVLATMNGRSCREVAREAGVSAATLNRVTRGEMPSVPVYLTLSAWLTDPVESAAQDMLEALQAAVECGIVPISSASEGGAMRHSRQVQVADMIRAAIAKATPHQHGAGNGEKHGG